jgi:hypothetical protein
MFFLWTEKVHPTIELWHYRFIALALFPILKDIGEEMATFLPRSCTT